MNEAERARRRLRIFAFSIALFFGGLAFVSWWTSRENLRAHSKVTSQGGAALEIGEIPKSYHAVYHVETRAGGNLVETTEKMWTRRPFTSRIEVFRGPPPGGRRTSVRQSAFGVLTNESIGTNRPLNLAAPPSLATGDIRIDAALQKAVEDKIVLTRERREVYERECQVYRAGGPVFAGNLTKYVGGSGEYADICIDEHGIVLEEYWVSDDKPVQRRIAVELEIDPSIKADVFHITTPEDPKIQRGAVVRVPKGLERPDDIPLWTLPRTPKGFDLLGRYAVAIPPDAIPQLGGSAPVAGPTSTTDVYVRGPDLLVVDQDPSLAGPVAQQGRPKDEVTLDDLKDAFLVIDARMSEVYATTPEGSLVRVIGTLPPDELVEFANDLRPQESED